MLADSSTNTRHTAAALDSSLPENLAVSADWAGRPWVAANCTLPVAASGCSSGDFGVGYPLVTSTP